MPLYEFSCNRCGYQSEVLVFLREELPFCEKCGGPMIKLISRPGIIRVGAVSKFTEPVDPDKPKPIDFGDGIKVYDMEFGHQERELLARKSEMDNM